MTEFDPLHSQQQPPEVLEGLPERYVLRELIGSGSSKRVHLAFDSLLQRPVAVASIRCDGREDHRRIFEEARTWSMLSDHPYVVNVHDVVESEGHIYVVQQYLQGGNLKARIQSRQEGWLSEDEALEIATKLSEALNAAHLHGVSHCDLKPTNVLFDQEGTPYLADFGIAQTVDWLRLGEKADHFGTPAYMAPEQIRSNRVDPKVDIYALGCLLYEMVYGEPAFGGTVRSVIEAKLSHEFSLPKEITPFVSTNYLELIQRLLRTDPAQRPTNMGEVGSRLSSIRSIRMQSIPRFTKEMLPQIVTVGYRAQQHELEEAMSFAEDQRARVVIVEGEAGMGKTHLVNRVGIRTAAHEALFIHSQVNVDDDRPFGAFVGVLERIRDHVVNEAERELVDRVIFPITPEDRVDVDDDVLNRLVEILLNVTERTSSVLVIDDLHWADPASIVLIEHLVRKVMIDSCGALCLVFCFRPQEITQRLLNFFSPYRQRDRFHTIELQGLSLNETKEWLMAQVRVEPARQLVISLKNASGGNPLFLKELFEHLQRSHALAFSDGRLVSSIDSSEIELPKDLVSVIARRVGEMSGDLQRAMTFASLMGMELQEEILRVIVSYNDQKWMEIIDEALTTGVLERTGEAYQFTHPLIQHAFLDRLTNRRRQRAHFEIAQKLISHYGDNAKTQCLKIAHHLVRGGFWSPRDIVVRYASLAANTAFSLYAFDLAGSYYRAACEAGSEILGPRELAAMHFRAGQAYGRGSDVGPSIEHLRESIRCFESVGDVEGLAGALELKLRNDFSYGQLADGQLADIGPLERVAPLVQDPELQVKIYDALASAFYNGGNHDKAVELGERALRIARATGVADYRCIPVTVLALCEMDQFRVRNAYDLWRGGLADAETSMNDVYTGRFLQRLPIPLYHLGRLEEASHCSERASQLNNRINSLGEMSINLTMDVMIANLRGDFTTAREAGHRGIDIVHTTRYPWAASALYPAVAQTHAMLGDRERALEIINELTTDGRVFDDARPYQSLGRQCRWLINGFCSGPDTIRDEVAAEPAVIWDVAELRPATMGSVCRLVDIAALVSAPALADTAYEALSHAFDKDLKLAIGWTHLIQRALGVAATLRGDLPDARGHFEGALQFCRETGIEVEGALTLINYGQLETSHASGDTGKGRDLLDQGRATLQSFGIALY